MIKMELKNLIDKPLSECSDEELEKRAHLLGRLKISTFREKPLVKRKTNADNRLDDLVGSLTPEQLMKLYLKLKENK